MVTAGVRRVVLVVAALGFAGLIGSQARGDEKKNPLREELLKLNSVTGEDAQRDKLVALAKDKEKTKKLVAEAGKMLKEAKGKENPFNFNGALMVARLAHFNKQYEVAEPFYEYLVESATKLKSGSKMVQAYEGLIDMYWDNKKYALVTETCQKFVDDMGPDEYEQAKPFILERLVQSMAKEEKFDEALRLADTLIEADREGWYFFQLKGWVLREQGKLPAAIEAYNKSLDKIDANKGLKADVRDRFKDRTRYILTGLYVDNKDVEKAAKNLQTLIQRNPDNATYKNDLGFIWADNDLKFEESEKLIKEALDLDKKEKEKLKKEGKLDEVKPNAAYLDSLGWVLFKQKKYSEALIPLKEAAADDEDGSHLEIWDHLADCHLALGQKKEAIAAWEKALKHEDLTKRDGERRRKVSEKLKKARAE
ncbi:Tetratricopeptide repeat protein [Gemmata sp. SH-PL17]|uniref:tetratricopeptide repeat protein n=1 Tax=Gemmata sp. SH-PL17 TaxID=1630693 RepID=UPI00078E9860|nr:tetratricopeptide repeat protein [Gemmata sp. SH-PL17]AMV27969.1 Tetratricopeptide repeat protein [Gemmata sp. SH-PL17]